MHYKGRWKLWDCALQQPTYHDSFMHNQLYGFFCDFWVHPRMYMCRDAHGMHPHTCTIIQSHSGTHARMNTRIISGLIIANHCLWSCPTNSFALKCVCVCVCVCESCSSQCVWTSPVGTQRSSVLEYSVASQSCSAHVLLTPTTCSYMYVHTCDACRMDLHMYKRLHFATSQEKYSSIWLHVL